MVVFSEFNAKMEMFILVFRNPWLAALAEFNQEKNIKEKNFHSLEEFREAASKDSSLKVLFEKILKQTIDMMKQVTSLGKPVLVVTQKDMKRNLAVQLLRIIHFVGKDTDSEMVGRLFCTVRKEAMSPAKQKKTQLGMKQAAKEIVGLQDVQKGVKSVMELGAKLGLAEL